jgi:hypothetical protein
MKDKKKVETQIRGWLPKENFLPSNQKIDIFSHLTRFQFVRLVYGIMLGALLVTPFGVYHSMSEPYVVGYLWGYDLPIGYIGLLLGIVMILYPRASSFRSLRFSSFIPIIGLFLLLTLIFSPNYYFINLQQGTNFSIGQIDIDFQIGNSAVVIFSLLSIVLGLASAIILQYSKKNKRSWSHIKHDCKEICGKPN